MRSQEEKRDIITTIRMSEKQRKTIQEKANMRRMAMGSYLVYAAVNSKTEFDPVMAVHAQNILNIARELAKKYQPELLEKINEEELRLWCM